MRQAVATACLRYLSRREYGCDELRHKLLAKAFPEAVVDEVLADLVREGLQSDVRFVASFTRDRVQKGRGPYRISRELRERGVDVEENPDLADTDWDELIGKVYVKRFGESLPDSLPERAARERFLVGRGFGREHIRRLFRRLRDGGDD